MPDPRGVLPVPAVRSAYITPVAAVTATDRRRQSSRERRRPPRQRTRNAARPPVSAARIDVLA